MGDDRISFAMAAESASGGFRLAPTAEVQSDLLHRRFIFFLPSPQLSLAPL